MFDIFKQPLTHISSIPEGCVEWLLVMLEQVLDVSKAFNLEDLWLFLNDFPETENLIIQIQYVYPQRAPQLIHPFSQTHVITYTNTFFPN